MRNRLSYCALLFGICLTNAQSATYQVGPSRPYANLQAVFDAVDLNAGDIVEVDGGVTYDFAAGIIMRDTDSGAPGNPVILRGISVGGARPILRGGNNVIEFRSSNNVVFENFEVVGSGTPASGTFRCIYHHADRITIRGSIIRDCPRHGILGADTDSGSLTVEYSQILNSGSNGGNHAIYMATDEVAYPGAVFRLQFCYLNDSQFDAAGLGGNLVKSRAERNEIYYNWLEGAFYHELELIGPDPNGAAAGWTENLKREDSDVVGNVILHTSDFSSVMRLGGDGTGQSNGRYRVVNNTIIRRNANNDTPTIFRLFDGLESLEFYNNVIFREGSAGLTLARGVEAVWTTGSARIRGGNNWIKQGYVLNPTNLGVTLSGTLTGTDPGLTNLAANNFQPQAGSPMLNASTNTTSTSPDYNISNFLFPPINSPPPGAVITLGVPPTRPTNGVLDIGAFEQANTDVLLQNGFEN
jgi:hypothetical protein